MDNGQASVPRLPVFPRQDLFKGSIIHSLDYGQSSILSNPFQVIQTQDLQHRQESCRAYSLAFWSNTYGRLRSCAEQAVVLDRSSGSLRKRIRQLGKGQPIAGGKVPRDLRSWSMRQNMHIISS